MKKVMAVTAGFLLALAPAGTASAGEIAVGKAKAYGNCQYNAVGGKPTLPAGGVQNGSGLGGYRQGDTCRPVKPQDPVDEIINDVPERTAELYQ